MYENNIKQHFIEYVERFVNVCWRKKQKISLIKKQKYLTNKRHGDKISQLCGQLRKIKNNLLKTNKSKSSRGLYHQLMEDQRIKILPARTLQKDSVSYHIKCSQQDYLPFVIYMMKRIKSYGASVMNMCPLRGKTALQGRKRGRDSGNCSKGKHYKDEVKNFDEIKEKHIVGTIKKHRTNFATIKIKINVKRKPKRKSTGIS
ncbi:hypothetical protein BDK51DRAFT_29591 [Blyttiomyces helicus]|uniref:Uncharacterized protein n=1 Tax=Blyttiomyces helicus TaxID=388810 RepID=A0A4P9WM39_9FUNG|nr:hypothetical protein BDK51DRAFT_29591 [Blyttiomyces helicus]|eukprot:RKO93512.1 hypothetical protein BDK51DRAFT_29591 [Blyttiomyces helicus]